MSVVGDVVSGFTNILAGRAQASALKTEAVMYERAARDEEVRGKQISAARRSQLVEALSTINAQRASRGLSIDSPSYKAIRDRQMDTFAAAENAEVLGSLQRRDSLRATGAARKRAAPYVAMAGYAKGLSDFGSAAEKVAASGG